MEAELASIRGSRQLFPIVTAAVGAAVSAVVTTMLVLRIAAPNAPVGEIRITAEDGGRHAVLTDSSLTFWEGDQKVFVARGGEYGQITILNNGEKRFDVEPGSTAHMMLSSDAGAFSVNLSDVNTFLSLSQEASGSQVSFDLAPNGSMLRLKAGDNPVAELGNASWMKDSSSLSLYGREGEARLSAGKSDHFDKLEDRTGLVLRNESGTKEVRP